MGGGEEAASKRKCDAEPAKRVRPFLARPLSGAMLAASAMPPRHSAGEAAVEMAADRARRPGKWRRFAREKFFGRRRPRVRILQRRQRLGIE
jgi:hypothetical protein